MKAIVTAAIFTSFSSRADKSLGFRGVTPELTSTEKVALIDLQGLNCRILIEPVDYATTGKVEVKGVLSNKTPSERLRGVLFILWRQQTDKGLLKGKTYDLFYVEQMARITDDIKAQLEPEA